MLISRPEDVSHLSRFTGEDSYLLVGSGWVVLLTDGRYAEQAHRECRDIEVFVRSGPMSDAVAEVLKGRGVRRLGVQGEHMTLAAAEALGRKLGGRRVVSVTGAVDRLRAVKDDAEVAAIRRAIRTGERAFRRLLARGSRHWVGRSERGLAAELDHYMRQAGADGPAFETIVAAGAHGSRPHYRPGAARIRRGLAVLVDWGAKVGGYCGDLTRVVFVGRIPPKLAEVYAVVLSAQRAGIAAIRPGVSGRTVDAAARKVIVAAGCGAAFTHGLGHGIGRQVHELPTLSSRATGRLRAGAVVTVEPGIYLPGVGGVRIEDDVLVTARGARRLSTLPRKLQAMRLR